jgi:hypothetical protein
MKKRSFRRIMGVMAMADRNALGTPVSEDEARSMGLLGGDIGSERAVDVGSEQADTIGSEQDYEEEGWTQWVREP